MWVFQAVIWRSFVISMHYKCKITFVKPFCNWHNCIPGVVKVFLYSVRCKQRSDMEKFYYFHVV